MKQTCDWPPETHVCTWAADRSTSETPDTLGSEDQSAHSRTCTGSGPRVRCQIPCPVCGRERGDPVWGRMLQGKTFLSEIILIHLLDLRKVIHQLKPCGHLEQTPGTDGAPVCQPPLQLRHKPCPATGTLHQKLLPLLPFIFLPILKTAMVLLCRVLIFFFRERRLCW